MRIRTAMIVAVLLLGAMAQAEDAMFSQTRLISLKPVKASKQACAELEATFSAPLQSKPRAMLDSDDSSLIERMVSLFLQVTGGPTRYRFSINAADATSCSALKRSNERFSVTIDGATGNDGKPLLPQEETIRTRSLF
jgi:hypothetical protein